MTEALGLEKGKKILEVGTGSGYQSAILFELGLSVFSIERIEELFNNAKVLFDKLGINVKLKLDDGSLGWQEFAPYDA